MILFQPIAVGIPLTIIPNLIVILRYVHLGKLHEELSDICDA